MSDFVTSFVTIRATSLSGNTSLVAMKRTASAAVAWCHVAWSTSGSLAISCSVRAVLWLKVLSTLGCLVMCRVACLQSGLFLASSIGCDDRHVSFPEKAGWPSAKSIHLNTFHTL